MSGHPCLDLFTNPVPKLSQMSISFNLDNIGLDISSHRILLKYQKTDNGCLVTNAKTDEKLLENQDFRLVFLEDLKLILKSVVTPIEMFMIYFKLWDLEGPLNQDKIADDFLNLLKSQNFKIHAKRLTLGTVSQSEVMSILPYFDGLESIEMSSSRYVDSIPMEINEIVELEVFKKLKKFSMSKLVTEVPLSTFGHLERVSIYRKCFLGEDLEELKKVLLSSSSLISFEINTKIIDKSQYVRILGEPEKAFTQWQMPFDKWTVENLQFSLFDNSDNNWSFSVNRLIKK
uniref:FTH domain-containing protein n=1 Tax=Caenorhabditis tropicalis TaxID=1561998 RepID=A0A1I7TUP5_9PELO